MSAAKPAPDRRAILGGSPGLAAAVAATAAPALADVALHPDAALLTLAEEMDRIEVKQCALDAAADAIPHNLDAELAAKDHDHVGKAIKDRIAAVPATTFDGLAVKARALALIYREDFSAEGLKFTDTTDVRLIWSILADLAPAHVVAPVEAVADDGTAA